MGLFGKSKKKLLNTEVIDEELELIDEEEVIVEETDEQLEYFIDLVINHFTRDDSIHINSYERGIITQEELLKRVNKYIESFRLTDSGAERVVRSFKKFLWSYDVIDELIDDDEISDIKIYSADNIRVKRLGKRESSNIKFRNEKHFLSFVEHTAVKNKVSISDMNAAQNFVDKKNSAKAILRFNITTGFINSSEKPVMHIRKIPKTKKTTEQLINDKFFTQETADYIVNRLINSDGILIAGKGGSGKTTLLNWMLDNIPTNKSGLVIQENEELFSNHPDMMFQHTVINRGEGKIEYGLQDLARNGLLTDLDYFIIGEVKGGEALYLLNAAYTGHKCIATVHGASSSEAMDKVVDYIKYNSDYTKAEAESMLVHFNTVIFMDDYHIEEITEIQGFDKEKEQLIYTPVKIN